MHLAVPLHRRLTAVLFIAPLVVVSLAVPRGGSAKAYAAASADAEARALFQRAEVHFNLGEFDRALALYSEAYRLKPLPGFLFNIAQCHRFMERFEDAAFSFRVYLDRAPEAANRADVEDLIVQMERRAAARPPADAKPALPELVPSAPAQPEGVRLGAETAPARSLSPWFWPTLGSGVALVAAGVITGQMASNRSDSYRDSSTPIDERHRLKDSGETLAVASVVCLGAGGLALAAAAALWWPTRAEGTRMAAAPVAGGSVFSVSGAF